MSKVQPSLMEVTRTLTSRAHAANFTFGEDTAIVAVQHMLWQTIDLFEAVVALGVKRENIFALGKVYSNSKVVMGALGDRGVNVIDSTIPSPGEFDRCFERDVQRLWELVSRVIRKRRIERILVLDDGGKCITSIPRELLKRYEVCGVEQTSFGIFQFETTPPAFPVMAWARAAVKLQIGGPLFSHCLLLKLQTRCLGGAALTGKKLGIIGLGSIGSATAHLAVRQHNDVIFFDPDPCVQVPSYLEGRIERVASLEELMLRCEYVFGCSGRNPFKQCWPLRYRPGIKLFSASGGDQEFGPIIRDLKQNADFKLAPRSWDISSDNGPSGPISIAYNGYPYNFVSRDIEAVPTGVVQIETGGLLIGLIQARVHLQLCEQARAGNCGIHRISPEAQRVVYETWLTAMKGRRIDLEEVYACDPSMLAAARNQWWFGEKSEPHPSVYEPHRETEEAMARLVDERRTSQLDKRNLEPDLCSL
ncbi:MAG TPA: NAD(P)-dependent oxidoreductase [Pyrinomonadaceae bacterium]|nr:NAD(P)-dependent oxidoreductase [Pyrinomonadaceae bacterium]